MQAADRIQFFEGKEILVRDVDFCTSRSSKTVNGPQQHN
jgi:hypothetical protein